MFGQSLHVLSLRKLPLLVSTAASAHLLHLQRHPSDFRGGTLSGQVSIDGNNTLQTEVAICLLIFIFLCQSLLKPFKPEQFSARELTFPSMAALIACLSPEPGERRV